MNPSPPTFFKEIHKKSLYIRKLNSLLELNRDLWSNSRSGVWNYDSFLLSCFSSCGSNLFSFVPQAWGEAHHIKGPTVLLVRDYQT